MSAGQLAWKRNTQGDLKFKFPTFLEDASEAVVDANRTTEPLPPHHSGGGDRLRDSRRSSERLYAARREMDAISDHDGSRGSSHSIERASAHRVPSSHGGSGSFHKQRRDGAGSSGAGSFGVEGVNTGRSWDRGGGGGGCCGGRQREDAVRQIAAVATVKLEKMERQQRELQNKQDATAAQLATLNSTMDRVIGGQAELAQLFRQEKRERQLAAERAAAAKAEEPVSARPRSPPWSHSNSGGSSSNRGSFERNLAHGHHNYYSGSGAAGPSDPPGYTGGGGDGSMHPSSSSLPPRGSPPPGVREAQQYQQEEQAAMHQRSPADDGPMSIVVYDEDNPGGGKLTVWEEIERKANQNADEARQRSQELQRQGSQLVVRRGR